MQLRPLDQNKNRCTLLKGIEEFGYLRNSALMVELNKILFFLFSFAVGKSFIILFSNIFSFTWLQSLIIY